MQEEHILDLQIYLTTIRKILLDIINQDGFIMFKLSFKKRHNIE